MTEKRMPRLLIGAAGSGCGKTTFTCGLLQALCDMGRVPVSFKCGPDYIDPMFHTEVLGIPSKNLDLFFSDENTVRYLMTQHGRKGDIAVIEGVMGYYDGLAGISPEASSWDLAGALQAPSVLLVDARGKSVSLLAEIKGFLEFEENSGIKGVILNRISDMMYPELKNMIEEKLPVKVLGYLPKMEDCSLESRHLGLVTAKEIKDLKGIIRKLADQIKKTVDVEAIVEMADNTPSLFYEKPALPEPLKTKVKIGIAKDKAFCFYYQDNLELLEELGAELVFFSPLEDSVLPDGISGMFFGGGYPELYLSQLAGNIELKQQIYDAASDGMPCMAECGGFMYLHERLADKEGNYHEMVGVISGDSYPVNKLGRFGYITLTAEKDNLLCKKGEKIKAHEFHYWDSTNTGECFNASKPLRKRSWQCIIGERNIFAGYPHIYFYSNPTAAANFLKACENYGKSKK